MATHAEIFGLLNDHVMKNKVAGAALVKANTISDLATPTTLQLDWAQSAYRRPIAVAEELWPAMLGSNAEATVAQITGASDALIQTAVNDAVDNIFTKAGA